MIEIDHENFAGIECLHATPAGMQHAPLPTILFWHGFTSSKEVYAYFALALAQRGFRVVMPDAQMHGSRYSGDAQVRLTRFWSILQQNIEEVPALIRALEESGRVADGRIAIGGASQGGMTALGAMVRNPSLRACASLMGSGYFTTLCQRLFPPLVAQTAQEQTHFAQITAPLAEYDVSDRLATLADRPLLVWHGDADEVVPASESQRLVDALRRADLDQHLTAITERGVGHRITPEALAATCAFYQQHL